jgi:hypothetical protein
MLVAGFLAGYILCSRMRSNYTIAYAAQRRFNRPVINCDNPPIPLENIDKAMKIFGIPPSKKQQYIIGLKKAARAECILKARQFRQDEIDRQTGQFKILKNIKPIPNVTNPNLNATFGPEIIEPSKTGRGVFNIPPQNAFARAYATIGINCSPGFRVRAGPNRAARQRAHDNKCKGEPLAAGSGIRVIKPRNDFDPEHPSFHPPPPGRTRELNRTTFPEEAELEFPLAFGEPGIRLDNETQGASISRAFSDPVRPTSAMARAYATFPTPPVNITNCDKGFRITPFIRAFLDIFPAGERPFILAHIKQTFNDRCAGARRRRFGQDSPIITPNFRVLNPKNIQPQFSAKIPSHFVDEFA